MGTSARRRKFTLPYIILLGTISDHQMVQLLDMRVALATATLPWRLDASDLPAVQVFGSQTSNTMAIKQHWAPR